MDERPKAKQSTPNLFAETTGSILRKIQLSLVLFLLLRPDEEEIENSEDRRHEKEWCEGVSLSTWRRSKEKKVHFRSFRLDEDENTIATVQWTQKRASGLYRTASTFYRCCLPALTGFKGSWSYRTCPFLCPVGPDGRRALV